MDLSGAFEFYALLILVIVIGGLVVYMTQRNRRQSLERAHKLIAALDNVIGPERLTEMLEEARLKEKEARARLTDSSFSQDEAMKRWRDAQEAVEDLEQRIEALRN